MDRKEITAAMAQVEKLLVASHPAEAVPLIERALAAAQLLDEPEILFDAARQAGWARSFQDDHATALAHFTLALATAERLPEKARARCSTRIQSSRLQWVAVALNVPGVPAARLLAIVDDAIASAATPTQRVEAVLGRARVLTTIGRAEEAWTACESVLGEVAALEPSDRRPTLCTAAWSAFDAGHHERALSLFEEARRLLPSARNGRAEAAVLNGMGHTLLQLGRAQEAYACASDFCRIAAPLGQEMEGAALGMMVDAARRVGRADEAWDAATRFLEIERIRGERDGGLLRALIDGVNVRLDRGEVDGADGLLAEAEPLAAHLDGSTGTTFWRDEMAKLRARREPR